MKKGIARIEKRLEELKRFEPETVTVWPDASVEVLEKSIGRVLEDTFGEDTSAYNRYRRAAHLDRAPVDLGRPTPIHEVTDGLKRGKASAVALLTEAIRELQEKLEERLSEPVSEIPEPRPFPKRVFVVHGHDDGAKEMVGRFLEKIGFEAVILHEKPNCGQTVIEKFEHHSDVGFAVVLLTPDDTMENGAKRARQNVILELGYFIAKLSRERVCALKTSNVEVPSDILGILWTDLDSADWRVKLAQELVAAGYAIDWNDVMPVR
jgi:predicted nucleotide-binding protein